MKHSPEITVCGLWHLGSVTAVMLAQEGFAVCGYDPDPSVVDGLRSGRPPVFEPGLAELLAETQRAGPLRFTSAPAEAFHSSALVWVAFDTPVDEQDQADVSYLEEQLDRVFPYIESQATILISSQVPVGFTDRLRQRWERLDAGKTLRYGYSPENLRLGNALQSFRADDRIVIGLDDSRGREAIEAVLGRFSNRLEWMSVKSAEMTKHALNSFLAVSVALANEIARLCEQTGADAKEVERGLKSESRIGPKAYLGPGGPFAGGTLARDLHFLTELGRRYGVETPLLAGALQSNNLHKNWVREKAAHLLAGVVGPARATILGLTYKAGTDTLRRSESVALALWLLKQGVEVIVHDPVVAELPEELAGTCKLVADLASALAGSDLLVLGTPWPIYREAVRPEVVRAAMRRAIVLDQNRFLAARFATAPDVLYVAVGTPGGSSG